MVITDHIDLARTASPLRYMASDASSSLSPLCDRLQLVQNESLYDPELIRCALAAARQAHFHVRWASILQPLGLRTKRELSIACSAFWS